MERITTYRSGKRSAGARAETLRRRHARELKYGGVR